MHTERYLHQRNNISKMIKEYAIVIKFSLRLTSQILVFSVLYVLEGSRVPKSFGETKIDDVHEVSFLPETHQKIVRLNISMNKIFAMYIFDSGYELIG